MNLAKWAEQFREVEQCGTHTSRVRLLHQDAVWHTWERDELTDGWLESATAMLQGLADSIGPGRHGVEFVAEDVAGNVRSRCPATVMGRNQAAPKAGTEIAALVSGMDSLARTMRGLLEAQAEVIERQQKMLTDSALRVEQMVAEREAEREENANSSQALSAVLTKTLGDHLGPILEVAPDMMRAYVSLTRMRTTPHLASVPNPAAAK